MNPVISLKKVHPFIRLWLITCVLYLPAWRAGFVTDAIDWLHDVQTLPLGEYLNRSHSSVHALYQSTQFITLIIYKLFGTARLPWFLLFVSLQALAAYLLYFLCLYLFAAANLRLRRSKAFWGAVVFCVSPYLSEVLVWKACFHYLEAAVLIFSVLICVERYIYTRNRYWPWLAAGLFLISAFALELFYLTPLFTASMLLFFRSLGWSMAGKLRTWMLIMLPQLAIFVIHLLAFHTLYGEWLSHGTGSVLAIPFTDLLAKGPQYTFHLVFFGRFWPQELKERIYRLCHHPIPLTLFYAALVALFVWLQVRMRKGYGRAQAGFHLLLWTLLAVLIAFPMPLEPLFDLSGNRYLYLPVAFTSMLLSMIANNTVWRWLKVGLACAWIGTSVFLTLRTNRHWQTSERINQSLLENVPQANGKTTILLAMPYCYKGVPMINAWPAGNFSRMHDALYPTPLSGKVYDGMAFNMIAPSNSAIAEVTSDSTVKVTLQQWGTWWWYMDFGGRSYETPDYRIDMRDQGHWYELVLKRPFDQYQLLYQVGDKWRMVTR